jgi:hypothetical protein
MTMDGSGFGLDGDGHYAYLDTEERIGTTIELIERPKGRQAPEKIYPPETSERPATVQPPSSRGPAPSGGLPGGPTSFGGQLAGGPPPGAPPLDEQPGSPEPSFRNGQGDYQ